MAMLSLCRWPFPTLSVGTVAFAADDLIPDERWNRPGFDQSDLGLLASGHRSMMTFRLSEGVRGYSVRLEIGTAELADPLVTFGGEVFTARSAKRETGLAVEIPRALFDRAVAAPLTLAVEPRTSPSLDLKILSLSVQPVSEARNG
jgi:hypothetical protein